MLEVRELPRENASAPAAPEADATGQRDRLLLLQVGRGLAALGVGLSHARFGTHAFVEHIPPWFFEVLAHGQLGVDFFFVLSGFIILSSHIDDERSFDALKLYALKRIARIYIPYLPVCLLLIAGYLLFPSISTFHRDWDGGRVSCWFRPIASPR